MGSIGGNCYFLSYNNDFFSFLFLSTDKKLKEKLKSKEKTIDSIQGLLQRKEEEQELREFIAEIRDVIAGGEEAQAEMKKELGNLEEQNSGTANEEDTLFLDKQSDEEAKGGVV
ncbi:uncharacterized protein LOC108648391 [Xenopus tropicalis]|uniref:Uncharacterized protein LOC108648391 n=1 Tax=Xenopus tropicalis TaxID=8364 RepID=A0A8J1IN87_XENTR|nr:uncharacterized protein LOC108648391 [Xenopus tropicalis]